MAMNFTVPSMIKITPIINGSASISASLVLTDHNRSALQIGENVIEQSNRMANGTLRKYIVSSKKDFSVEWTDIPSAASATVDGKAGAVDIKSYYNSYFQYPQKLDIFYGSGSETFNVFFKDFKLTISKRSSTNYDFYNVSAGWDQI
jgi:hypothetical protein